MTEVCVDCGAKMFPWESSKMKTQGGRTFSLCCSYGTIRLLPFKEPTPALKNLFTDKSAKSTNFLENIRLYNGLLAMSSKNITGKLTDFSKCKSKGPNIFKMSGQMYHLLPNLFAEVGNKPKFSQIYVYDNESEEQELDTRIQHIETLTKINKNTLKILQNEINICNPYVAQFKNAAKVFRENPQTELKIVFKAKGSVAAKKKKIDPHVKDVVIVAPGEQTEPRDVVLYRNKTCHPNHNDTIHIDENHVMYDPTAYPLILPFGDDGYSIDRNLTKTNSKKITALQFYRFHFQVRQGFNTLLRSGRLYQEWLCDMWSKIERSRLAFIKYNQDQLRIDHYSGLQDALFNNSIPANGEGEKQKIGRMIILPASFTSSPRYMYSHYLDALAIAREYKKFTLFITMTSNPKWTAVHDNLFEGQQAYNRPDIMNRIFNQMLHQLLSDLKKGALGPLKSWLYTIEGQLRCLKHAHILLLLSINLTVEDIDQIISAQIPNPQEKPELHKCVSQYMLHGPCGPAFPNAPCMQNGKCSKDYPKEFQEETKLPVSGHGYPIYARPNNGRTIEKNGFIFDNRWVVPHNEYLSVKFDCHINVEFVGSFLTVKYIYKYVHKGVDVSTIGIEERADRDEITQFINARTIDPYDAHWRMSEYKVQDRFPAVQKLAIHTEGQQQVIFRDGEAEVALETVKDTTLTAYFKLNQTDVDARQYKYQDIPKYYTWNNNKWKKRQYKVNAGDLPRTIGRINSVSPLQGERFYLRLLLNHILGAQSFENLKIFNGQKFQTYKETCLAMGLLEDDSEWYFSMQDISSYASPAKIRAAFAVILNYCCPAQPKLLFDKFLENMSDDFIYQEMKARQCDRTDVNLKQVEDSVVNALESELSQMGTSLSQFPDMPQPVPLSQQEIEARLISEEIYNTITQSDIVTQLEPLLNSSQIQLYEDIYQAVHAGPSQPIPKLFVVNSPGGYGKTFVLKLIAAKIRSEGGIVICVASTGLAAQNLQGGRTAHSRFKIPIEIFEDSTCSIKAQSSLAKLLKYAQLIIWDEIFSCHRYNLEAVDRTLQDLMNNKEPFGGKVVCLAGDPRQTLPVVKRGGRTQIVRACIQMSPLYHFMKQHKLLQNMRTDPEEIEFSNYILRLGDGKEKTIRDIADDIIKIPQYHLVGSLEELINTTFPNLQYGTDDIQSFIDATIYTPLNENVREINELCISRFPGKSKKYLSADSILEDDHKENIPPEFLNAMTPSGLPDHCLTLKEGAPVMLLRNLQAGPSCSLRNGTRMTVIQLMERAVEVEVAVGTNKGLRVFLPRIPHYDRSGEFPFTVVRRQFPLRLAFAVTINKGQGQENERVGIHLPAPVFSHGQLYTAMSRAKRSEAVKVYIGDNDKGYTNNIVYTELLQ